MRRYQQYIFNGWLSIIHISLAALLAIIILVYFGLLRGLILFGLESDNEVVSIIFRIFLLYSLGVSLNLIGPLVTKMFKHYK